MLHNTVCGIQSMTAAQVATAMAMIIAKREFCDIMGFADIYKKLHINVNSSLEYNMSYIYKNTFGATDISLPFTHALIHQLVYDVFIVFTDNETNCNTIHPIDAINLYRNHINKNVKLIVVALSANKFSVADPDDSCMLDIAGFDAETPQVIRDFVLQ
jgi:60 kDa SS-A/Ro ribonucleoprotein